MRIETEYNATPSTIFSIGEFIDTYFYGIPFPSLSFKGLLEDTIQFYLDAATKQIEDRLGVQVVPKQYYERRDFNRSEFFQWGAIKVSYPIMEVLAVSGFIGTVRQITYPPEWITIYDDANEYYSKRISIVPIHASAEIDVGTLAGYAISRGYYGFDRVPEYWFVSYITGFNELPEDIRDAIGKYASLGVFNMLGDLVIGAGIANKTLSLDGFAETITTTSSAENAAYSARIRQYILELKTTIPLLEQKYKGVSIFA